MTDDQFYLLLRAAAILFGSILFGRYILGPVLLVLLR